MSEFSEERKRILLGLFQEALESNGLDDLAILIDVCYTESWHDLSADEIWRRQSEILESDSFRLPEELGIFYLPTPDWSFAEANLRQYGQTF
jgi:hypothetical protein